MAYDYAEEVAAAIEAIQEFGRRVTISTPPPEGAGSAFDPAAPLVVQVRALQGSAKSEEIDGDLITTTSRRYLFAGDAAIGTNSTITDGVDRSVSVVERVRPGDVVVLTKAWTKQ